jgi:hypothetical protein
MGMNHINFHVRPDGGAVRLVNQARVAGLIGVVLYLLAGWLRVREMETLSGIVSIPAYLLCLGNLVWIYLMPSILMGFLYSICAIVVWYINLVHIIILQRNSLELSYFLARFYYLRTKLGIAFLGFTEKIPHVDVFSSDKLNEQVSLEFRTETYLPARWLILRLGALAALAATAYLLMLGVRNYSWFKYAIAAIPGLFLLLYIISMLVNWSYNAITGRFITVLVDLHLRIIRLNVTVAAWFSFLINDHTEFKTCLRSVLMEGDEAGRQEQGWINPGDEQEHNINLIVLLTLILITCGVYLFIWLARTAKVMGDDPFTVVSVAILGFTVPLSVFFSRYYRRLEHKSRNEPSWILELFLVIPFLNLLLAPFTIQYLLNLFKRRKEV